MVCTILGPPAPVWEQEHIKPIYRDRIFHSYGIILMFAYILTRGLCTFYGFCSNINYLFKLKTTIVKAVTNEIH